MKAILFAVAVWGVLGASVCAPSDEAQPRGSNCIFDPNKDKMCREQGQKIAIPCESQCKSYYQCDEQLMAQIKTCGFLQGFDVAANDCTTKANCNWYKQDTTSSPQWTSSSQWTTASPMSSTTKKGSGASATSAAAALFLVSGAAVALVSRAIL